MAEVKLVVASKISVNRLNLSSKRSLVIVRMKQY